MDHTEAAENQAVERYMLGEMTEREAKDFERHYFTCPICSEELTMGALLEENARALPAADLATDSGLSSRFKAWWRQPMFAAPAFAALALAVLVGYQAQELSRLKQPHALSAHFLKAVRGDGQTVIPADSAFVELSVDLPPDASFPAYRCDVSDVSGRLRFSVPVHAPSAGVSLSFEVPQGLAPGEYVLRVWGIRGNQQESEIGHYQFESVKR